MGGQNTSSAVMQQRAEPHDSLDDFPTPPWATRALIEWLTDNLPDEAFNLGMQSCREPSANRGHMVKPLFESFGHVMASDICDYGAGFLQRDYLFGPENHLDRTDWTISNPPFRLAVEFIERAIALSRIGVAMLVRSAFMEGGERYHRLYSQVPPSYTLQFTERVIMHKGALRDPSKLYWDEAAGKWKKPSTATAYCWMIWLPDRHDARLRWIAPCRKRLERPGDYPEVA